MHVTEITLDIKAGGDSQKIATSTSSAQSNAVTLPAQHPAGQPVPCTIVADAQCFVRKGANPTAVSDGTDQILLANTLYRVQLMPGEKLAFILASSTGNVYFTQNA